MQSDGVPRESDHDDPGYGHRTRRANQNWGECKAVIDRIDTKITELQATRQDVSETMACQRTLPVRLPGTRTPMPSDTEDARVSSWCP